MLSATAPPAIQYDEYYFSIYLNSETAFKIKHLFESSWNITAIQLLIVSLIHILAKDMLAISNQGAYASHGHAIAANGLTAWRLQYACPNIKGEAYTVYTLSLIHIYFH